MNDLSSFFIRFTFQDGRKFDFSEETHVELVIFKYRQVKAFLYGEYLSKEEIINKGIEYEFAGIDSNSDDEDSALSVNNKNKSSISGDNGKL
jgi:hypothetical protein